MLTRRRFLQIGAAAGIGLLLPKKDSALHIFSSGSVPRAFAAIAGGSLLPTDIPKYQDALVIPPAMPRTAVLSENGQQIDYYEIAIRQFSQYILPVSMNKQTTVWSYGSETTAGTYNYPAFTLEAKQGKPLRVKWMNKLVDASGNYLPHLLPVDPTLHWANPPGPRDMRPTFSSTPGRYMGPVPMVTHLHGGHTAEESDGYAEAWYLPQAKNIPAGYFTEGTFYNQFKAKFADRFGVQWGPGFATFQYENDERASTLWYHDHTLGMTRLNVYAGPAGFYNIRGGSSDLPAGVLPGPAPQLGDRPGTKYYEIPIVVQDRSFNADGSLFYPDSREFFDGYTGPFIPDTPVSPIWNPEFFGNVMVTNGRAWPVLEVEARRYRFRFLNGCQARTLILKMVTDPLAARPASPALPFWQIGSDGGFLPAPVQQSELLMGNAYRADVIVDFTGLTPGTEIYLINEGPDGPYNGAFDPSDPETTGQVIKFIVAPTTGSDTSTPPGQLTLPAFVGLGAEERTRQVALLEEEYEDPVLGGIPTAALLGVLDANGQPVKKFWMDPVTENPPLGAIETWEIKNYTVDAHPVHVHEIQMQLVNRQPFDPATGQPTGPARGPEVGEAGYKDTFIALPGEITRIKGKFDLPGRYVWHCHIVEHEDNEMMRPYDTVATAGFPRTSVLDNFNRANGNVGGNWIGPGTIGQRRYSIQGYPPDGYVQVRSTLGLLSYMFWNGGTFGANQEAYFTFTKVSPTADEQDLLLKVTNLGRGDIVGLKTAMIAVRYSDPMSQIQIATLEPGLRFTVQKKLDSVKFAAGDVFGARALADGSVIVFKNGVAVGSTNVAAIGSSSNPWRANFAKGGGQIGVWFAGRMDLPNSNQAGFDNFGGGNM